MNFLLHYSLGFDLLFLVILLVCQKSVSSSTNYNENECLVIMPVTTRSKTRLLTGSSNELSTAISTGTKILSPSHLTSIRVLSESDSLQHVNSFPSASSPLCNSTIIPSPCLLQSSFVDHHCSGMSASSVSSFRISKFENLEFSDKIVSNFSKTSPVQSIFTQFSNMEADCQDHHEDQKMSKDAMDLTQILTTLSHQIANQNNAIQEHIKQNDVNYQRVVQENDNFKRDMRAEMDNLRTLLSNQQSSNSSNVLSTNTSASIPMASAPNVTPMISSLPSPISSVPTAVSSVAASQATTSPDMQTQMLVLLSESFSKLSNVLSEKKDDTKVNWPKFSGDQKKFRTWYLAIMAQLSLSPWKDLYDPVTNNVVKTTTNDGLNGKLYAKLLLSLEGSVLQNVVSRTHLRANGVLLLQDLVNTYKPRNVPEVIAVKTSQFWGNTKRMQYETVDDYYNRFHELLDELSDAEEAISTKSAMRHFIFTLGNDFESIQNNFRIGNLPPAWHTDDWPTLLVLCRDYFNSVKPFGVSKGNSTNDSNVDRVAQRKKVREWFMNPGKFSKEIEAEQCLHPGKCIFHLSKSHQTNNCDVKKECDKLLQAKKSSSNSTVPSTSTSGRLRHITEEEDGSQDIEFDYSSVASNADSSNDTNDDVLSYFSRVSNHYLRLVKTQPELLTRHTMEYPIIADSGANFHMFRDREFFESIQLFSGKVVLGDGQTTLDIQGIGTIKLQIGDHILSIENVRYIPDLAESIYSLFLHIHSPNHGLQSSFEDGLRIIFPTFSTKAILGTDDVYLAATPVGKACSNNPSCSDLSSIPHHCNHFTHTPDAISIRGKKEDNLLRNLRQYNNEVKTRRQLNLEVPAGFSNHNTFQRQVIDYHLNNVDMETPVIDTVDSLPPSETPADLDQISNQALATSESVSSITTNSQSNPSSTLQVPILRCIDKPSSSLPFKITYTEDFLRASVGFCRIDTMKSQFNQLHADTVKLDTLPPDAVLDAGVLANMKKTPRNTTPVPRPSRFAEVIHMDIVFGPEISLGNIHYALLLTDRYSRMTYLYPLQNLTSDIRKQLEYFFAHIGMIPRRLITDFDTKLICGKARDYLNSLTIHVNAAPANRQDHNGLAECHWQTIVCMARNWSASAELPSTFWFYAACCTVEVCNYR